MRPIAVAAALVSGLAACSDLPSPAEPISGTTPVPTAKAQGPPTDASETFTVDFCPDFQILVELNGKAKTIDLGRGRTIFTAPGLTATLTNLENQHQETFGITGALHQKTLADGDVEFVWTGRSVLMDPIIPGPGLFLAIGRFSAVFDEEFNLVQPLQGTGQLIDLCELLA